MSTTDAAPLPKGTPAKAPSNAAGTFDTRRFVIGGLLLVALGLLARLESGPMIKAWRGQVRIGVGQILVDLKDPKTLADVKRMMHAIKPNYVDSLPTWSGADWVQYAIIIEAIAKDLGVNKNGSVAYVKDGKVVTGWPPEGTSGFPSLIGIQNMAEQIKKLDKKTDAQIKAEYPAIASYGSNAVGTAAPNFAKPGVAASSGPSPLLWGLGLAALLLGAFVFAR